MSDSNKSSARRPARKRGGRKHAKTAPASTAPQGEELGPQDEPASVEAAPAEVVAPPPSAPPERPKQEDSRPQGRPQEPSAGHKPQAARGGQHDPVRQADYAWKIYLAELSEEGVALVDDKDARELAKRCFTLAGIFLEEQARSRRG